MFKIYILSSKHENRVLLISWVLILWLYILSIKCRKHSLFKKTFLHYYHLLLQQYFYSHPFLFYSCCYHLLKPNTYLASNQKKFRNSSTSCFTFINHYFVWNIIIFLLNWIIIRSKHFFILTKIIINIFGFMLKHQTTSISE